MKKINKFIREIFLKILKFDNKFFVLILIFFGLVLLGILLFIGQFNLTGNVVNDLKENIDGNKLENNCDCLERNKLDCRPGFFLQDNHRCWSGRTFTNAIRTCSKYNCPEEKQIYIWNLKEEKWQKSLN